VGELSFPTALSSDHVFVAAEKSFQSAQSTQFTQSPSPGPLGPVKFRNVAYLKQDGWHQVTALYAIVDCCENPNCIPIPYGVAAVGPNHIIAGTSISKPKGGDLLWDSTAQVTTRHIPQTDNKQWLILGVLVAVSLASVAVIRLKDRNKLKVSRRSKTT
jgi:hypothetical protein